MYLSTLSKSNSNSETLVDSQYFTSVKTFGQQSQCLTHWSLVVISVLHTNTFLFNIRVIEHLKIISFLTFIFATPRGD